ncbi:hypothetical protein [Methylovirgula sp. 4M-Z18]|uniref:hypothetical protein n=1 Tax=Methylovirgula sp. 4M-Z18 TaxID=2293567 RepID=UPI000E2F9B88|nr:hypothetical protein [Methylovirgula sp. 4M-Z18]RFB80392.1 hypothetical protein DYH55_02370 [Methylovirgula sp. 4M-Z18]
MTETYAAAATLGAPPKRTIRFVGEKSRLKTVPLEWPVEVDGVPLNVVVIKRMTAGEIDQFVESARGETLGARYFPLFADESGALLPGDVLDSLDDDDMLTLLKEAEDFLPRRFRTDEGAKTASDANDPNASAPTPGDTIAPS